jgi:cytochrome P450
MMTDSMGPVRPHAYKIPPGPCGYPIFGILPRVWQHPLRYFTDAARRYGEVISLPLGFRRVYLLNHPDHIKRVLQDQPDHYRKSVPRVARLKPLFGEGLTTSEGPLWRRQRRLLQPVFQHQRLVSLAPVITEATATMLERWQIVAARGQPLDVAAAMLGLTREIISKLLFGDDVDHELQAVGEALTTAFEHLNQRVWAVMALPACFPTSRNRHFRQAMRRLDTFVYRLIDERCQTHQGRDDLLSRLVAARDEETSEHMPATQLRDEVMTLFTAGHTTTSAALAWTFYLLAQHPEVERTLTAELATVLDGRLPTARDLPSLAYTRMVIEEGMRLYPPTWVTARMPLEDDEIGGYRIPAQSVVLLSPYVLHRHPTFWEHPERFEPERFSPAQSARRPRFAYFPFGGGPRLCIGQSLAMMEMLLILAIVTQAYQLRLVPGHPVEPQAWITLRPRHGILMTLHERPPRFKP